MYQMLLPTKKIMKLNKVPKKVALTAILVVVFCTVVLCKQDSRYVQDTKRLNFKLNYNNLYQDNQKILRPKRDVSSSGWSNKKSMHDCTWDTPLNKKYFSAYHEENREIHGCTSSEQTQSGVLVHAIHLNTTNSHVLLTIEDNSITSSGIVLLLYSVTPVTWRLSFNGDAYYSPTEEQGSSYSRNVMINSGSTLENYQDVHVNVFKGDQLNSIFEDEQQFQTKKHAFDESVIQKIRNTWGALTTFSRISSANRIIVTVPQDESLPQKCIIKSSNSGNETQNGINNVQVNNSLSVNGNVAYMITKQPATGCFHEEVAETSEEDVYVIDLQSADDDTKDTSHKSNSNQKIIKNSTYETDDSLLPNVYLSLAPEKTENGLELFQRDLKLILHSKQKVKWYLESIDLSGKLKVISTNGPVFNQALAASQKLSIENNPLPAVFDQLWKAVVINPINNPISYARIKKANVFTILVPNRPKQGYPLSPINSEDDKATIGESNTDCNKLHRELEEKTKAVEEIKVKIESLKEEEYILTNKLVNLSTENDKLRNNIRSMELESIA